MGNAAPSSSALSARPLRLALVYDCLYPQTIGGIEHRNAQLATMLSARGHRVTLAGLGTIPAPVPGVEILSLGRSASAGPRRSGASAVRFAASMFRLPLGRFDLVEAANVPFAHLFPLALRCRVARVPLLVTWHEVWGSYWRSFSG
ncbi:MAG: glycosyltransferase, partial [Acidobacteriota bacterium]